MPLNLNGVEKVIGLKRAGACGVDLYLSVKKPLDAIVGITGQKATFLFCFYLVYGTAVDIGCFFPDKDRVIPTGFAEQNARFADIDQSRLREKQLGKLTDPFFTTRKDEGGTGLGLFISQRIISEHKGSLVFASELGNGLTARILLPSQDTYL